MDVARIVICVCLQGACKEERCKVCACKDYLGMCTLKCNTAIHILRGGEKCCTLIYADVSACALKHLHLGVQEQVNR